MKNLPQKIFLQVDADGELPEDFSELEVVTWCEERIHETDVEYVLKPKCFNCGSDSILEFKSGYQCRQCWFTWEK
jgi:hypothetical protein